MSADMDTPDVIAIWQGGSRAKWMSPVADACVPNDDWSGYLHVDADAGTRTVEIADLSLTPREARLLAQAVIAAADHAEQHVSRVTDLLAGLACSWPELAGQAPETQRLVRELLRATTHRIRREDGGHHRAVTA